MKEKKPVANGNIGQFIELHIKNSDNLAARIVASLMLTDPDVDINEVRDEAAEFGTKITAIMATGEWRNLPVLLALTALYTGQLADLLKECNVKPVNRTVN